jgi:hypothetical protein
MEQIAVLDGLELTTPVPGEGQNYSGGSSWAPGFPYRLQQDGLASYLAAFASDGQVVTPVPGEGQNYSGGSAWFPGAPYRLQQEGLAGSSNIEMEVVTPVPGGGQNYSGGSSWAPGVPYRLQQDGLAGAALRGSLAALRESRVPDAARRAQGMANRAMASLPAWARGSTGAAAYFAAFYTATMLGQTPDQARATARMVLDSIG